MSPCWYVASWPKLGRTTFCQRTYPYSGVYSHTGLGCEFACPCCRNSRYSGVQSGAIRFYQFGRARCTSGKYTALVPNLSSILAIAFHRNLSCLTNTVVLLLSSFLLFTLPVMLRLTRTLCRTVHLGVVVDRCSGLSDVPFLHVSLNLLRSDFILYYVKNAWLFPLREDI